MIASWLCRDRRKGHCFDPVRGRRRIVNGTHWVFSAGPGTDGTPNKPVERTGFAGRSPAR